MKLKRSNSYSGFEIDTIDNDFKLDDEVDIKERQTEHDKTCHENNCRYSFNSREIREGLLSPLVRT
jgi:hypothetical protein